MTRSEHQASDKSAQDTSSQTESAQPHHEGPSPLVIFIILIVAILLLALVFAAIKVFVVEPATGRVPQPKISQYIQEQGSIETHFCQREDCEAAMVRELSAGSARCAYYDLDLPLVTQELVRQHANVLVFDENVRGVKNISVQSVPSSGLMHHKFCIVRNGTAAVVLTGSVNPTMSDARRNDNVLIVLRSRQFAAAYDAEWESLASRTSNSYKKKAKTPLRVNLSGALIELRFCPQDYCEEGAVGAVHAASKNVSFMLYTFTSDALGLAFLDVAARGIAVRGVIERQQANVQSSEWERLRDSAVDTRLDGNKYLLHHKTIIIDGDTVVTGSYNPTKSADERNDENMLIIHNERIAKAFASEFSRVWQIAPMTKE